jgi:hypothetical protein
MTEGYVIKGIQRENKLCIKTRNATVLAAIRKTVRVVQAQNTDVEMMMTMMNHKVSLTWNLTSGSRSDTCIP